MKYLLDTHVILWMLEDDPQLSVNARNILKNPENELFVSVISFFEIAIKTKIGKMDSKRNNDEITDELNKLSINLLPINNKHLDDYQLISLIADHRDPFDRLIIATAFSETFAIISIDEKFSKYSGLVEIIW